MIIAIILIVTKYLLQYLAIVVMAVWIVINMAINYHHHCYDYTNRENCHGDDSHPQLDGTMYIPTNSMVITTFPSIWG